MIRPQKKTLFYKCLPLDVTRPRTAWMNLMKIFAEWFSRKKIIRKLYLPSGMNLYNVHFINLAEIQCICKMDFSKVSWNGLYFNYRPFHKNEIQCNCNCHSGIMKLTVYGVYEYIKKKKKNHHSERYIN